MPYKIIRMYKIGDRRPRTIKKGLTLEEAQEHCRNPKTRGKTWFDGFTSY